jgi:hypothetical protein
LKQKSETETTVNLCYVVRVVTNNKILIICYCLFEWTTCRRRGGGVVQVVDVEREVIGLSFAQIDDTTTAAATTTAT